MLKSTTAYIGLGSNLGDRSESINQAVRMLFAVEQIEVIAVSDVIETIALGNSEQPKYLNTVAKIKTSLNAKDLFTKLCGIETELGRIRLSNGSTGTSAELCRMPSPSKWLPRTIDLDLLLFGDEIINEPDLIVPHSQMHLRTFALKGMCQLDGQLPHPVLKESMNNLAARLNGADFALNYKSPQLISIAGVIGVGKTTLAEKLSSVLNCKTLFEQYDTNPFLPEVYAGKKQAAFDSQMYFLKGRIKQLDSKKMMPPKLVISDYVFEKELIYAEQLLNLEQLVLYKEKYNLAKGKVSPPVLIIYLRDSAENCLERIHRRSRPYEQQIELSFLNALDENYENLFNSWKRCPVIRIEAAKLDYSKTDWTKHLIKQIRSYIIGTSVIAKEL
ncbi:MAG: 2-amino-4-hydroxy-6-hydroxymethyldihydropteridine diphosphokinase [Planctomycetes bacterium]|nr:2-amino-4-hydroxy-6-hydroxymethyldihydropteridine diphosphokinase [Planctomycetota bacterium]